MKRRADNQFGCNGMLMPLMLAHKEEWYEYECDVEVEVDVAQATVSTVSV